MEGVIIWSRTYSMWRRRPESASAAADLWRLAAGFEGCGARRGSHGPLRDTVRVWYKNCMKNCMKSVCSVKMFTFF